MSYLLEELDGKIENIQSDLNSTRRKISAAQGEIQNAMSARNAAVVQLAQIYLPDLKADTVKGAIDQIDDEAKVAYDAHKQRSSTVDASITRLEAERITLQKTYTAAAKKFKDADEFEDGVRAELESRIKTDSVYLQRAKTADQKEEILNRHVERSKDAIRERDTKLPSYEQNPLFNYLLKVGYETKDSENSEYQPTTGLVRRIDRMVASLINFTEQYQTYAKLKQLPELIHDIVEAEEAEVKKVRNTAEARREEIGGELNLPKALKAEKELRDHLAETKAELDALESNYSKLTAERTALQTANNRFYQEALTKAQKILGSTSLQELRDIARRTPDTRDDRLVEKMSEYELTISRQQSVVVSLQLDERRTNSTLSTVQSERDAEHRRIEEERRKREEQRRREEEERREKEEAEATRRRIQMSSSHSHSSGGGFSSGGFHSGGGFSGGGFRSGGHF